MLAALVVLLLREFFNRQSWLRVVYIPDCGLLLNSFKQLQHMRRSLLLAFADDVEACQIINRAKKIEDLEEFMQLQPKGTILFVTDQFNALTVHAAVGGPQDPLMQQKVKAEQLISSFSDGHFIIRAISINDDNKEEVERKQTNQRRLQLFGELSEVSPVLCTCAIVLVHTAHSHIKSVVFACMPVCVA